MKKRLLEHLICPTSKQPLQLKVEEWDGDEIKTGTLTSAGGAHTYKIEGYVPRFVPSDEYADSFSKQRLYVRRHFKHYKDDRSGDDRFTPQTGFEFKDLDHGLSLEVGCGYGRFLDVIDRRSNGDIIGIDLSTHSVDLAQEFAGKRKHVHIIQCDLFKPPFALKTIDRIFSLGVLHHTPDTKQAFEALVPLLKPNGKISIWVYPPEMKTVTDKWRKYMAKWPHSVLYRWCILNQVLTGWIRGLPGGWRFGKLIPGATPRPGRHFWQRVLSDFDNLSPTYAFSHSPEEVEVWFKEAGLEEVKSLEWRTSVTGKAPA